MTIMNDLKFDRTVSAALQDIGSMTFPKGNLFRNALPQQYPKPMTMASGISFPDLLWE